MNNDIVQILPNAQFRCQHKCLLSGVTALLSICRRFLFFDYLLAHRSCCDQTFVNPPAEGEEGRPATFSIAPSKAPPTIRFQCLHTLNPLTFFTEREAPGGMEPALSISFAYSASCVALHFFFFYADSSIQLHPGKESESQ